MSTALKIESMFMIVFSVVCLLYIFMNIKRLFGKETSTLKSRIFDIIIILTLIFIVVIECRNIYFGMTIPAK